MYPFLSKDVMDALLVTTKHDEIVKKIRIKIFSQKNIITIGCRRSTVGLFSECLSLGNEDKRKIIVLLKSNYELNLDLAV